MKEFEIKVGIYFFEEKAVMPIKRFLFSSIQSKIHSKSSGSTLDARIWSFENEQILL